MTRQERIAMVERNLRENDKRLNDGQVSSEEHARIKSDGKKCLSEIRARPASYFSTPTNRKP